MAHTCQTCHQTFDTLTRLRLHDCPGPTTPDPSLCRALVEAITAGLDRGDVVEPLPAQPLVPAVIEHCEDEAGVIAAFSVMSGSPDQRETERFGLATAAGAYVLELFPDEGWVVVREYPAGDESDNELRNQLVGLVQDWQATVETLVMEYATDHDAYATELMKEIGRRP